MRTIVKEENKKIKSIVLTEEFAIDDGEGNKVIFEPGDELDIVYSDNGIGDETDEFVDDGVPEPVDVVSVQSDNEFVGTDDFVDPVSSDIDDVPSYDDVNEDDGLEVTFDEFGNPIV